MYKAVSNFNAFVLKRECTGIAKGSLQTGCAVQAGTNRHLAFIPPCSPHHCQWDPLFRFTKPKGNGKLLTTCAADALPCEVAHSMPVPYRIAFFVTILSVLFLSPSLSRAQSGQTAENAVSIPFEPPNSTSSLASGEDAQKNQQKTGFWTGLWNNMTDEAHLTVGYGTLEAKLTIRRKSDGATATMAQRDTSAIFLGYSTRSSFFKDSNFGYTFMVNYVNFDMGKQEVHRNEYVDFGTEITGQMIYAVPTLYYQWGEHHYKGTFVRLGVGAGVGAATYSGTVQLTGTQGPGEKIYTTNKSYAPKLTLSDFLEARWHHFGISISYAAPRIYGDDYDITVSDYSVNVSYAYYF